MTSTSYENLFFNERLNSGYSQFEYHSNIHEYLNDIQIENNPNRYTYSGYSQFKIHLKKIIE